MTLESSNSHLSFPSSSADTDVSPTTHSSPQSRPLLKDRLYVGNLHPTVDEYTLLKIFSKFGKVTKLDYLFHKTGPCRGKPRGYAFVEYGDQSDALKALGTTHDKLLRGRKLVVTFAHQAPFDTTVTSAHASLGQATKFRKGLTEASRPTTLSLLKSGLGSRNEGTRDKIAIMEAKLQQMEQSDVVASTSSPQFTSFPPFLPAKPTPLFPDSTLVHHNQSRSIVQDQATTVKGKGSMNRNRKGIPLPTLPILPRKAIEAKTTYLAGSGSMESLPQTPQKPSTSNLAGVRIGRMKDRVEPNSSDAG